MSTFGGPNDNGVSPSEGLALIDEKDLHQWWFKYLFLDAQPENTTGLARRLNPFAYYIAMRWDYDTHPREKLRHSFCRVRSTSDRGIFCRPVDFGPNGRLNRLCDLSPAAAVTLQIKTDDIVRVDIITPLP